MAVWHSCLLGVLAKYFKLACLGLLIFGGANLISIYAKIIA
ncbi:hypothetical protein GMES_1775 [Paraglaciecola mesophila KMM 241]|uniref:Uncharacterized protein n=1 Tax=Paraglaciecola mesophila KMM 241 TaxID=1128912 RepID=K6YJ98_9ALTE|nr:hypothetical protein GMES_1775 [Paraglaciecola mesophila KMM 241]